MKDLIILVPDKNIKFVLDGLLPRYHSFGIRELTYDIYIHPLRDPGVFLHGAEFLRSFQTQYHKAFVFLDKEGSGQENKTSIEIEEIIKSRVETFGWRNKIEVIAFDPELEIWAWVQSPHLATHLGWENLQLLVSFIQDKGFWELGHRKPERPKEAIEAALKEKRIQRSSAIYKRIAETVSFAQCQEPSFVKFKEILINWFAIGDQH